MSTVQALSAPQGLSMPTAKKIFAFASMCVGMFIALIDIQIVSASLRDIGGGLSAGDDETVWVQTSYLIAEIIIIPLSGWLARVMSTRWLFAASAAGFTLMSLLCGWAWNIQSMIAFRALQGLAGGSMIPLVFTTAFAFFQGKQRVIAAATIGGLASLAPTLGPTVGGWITENYNWHWLFFINVVPGIYIAVAVPLLVKVDSADPTLLRGADYLSILLLALSLGCLEYTLEEGPRWGWFDDATLTTTAWVALLCGVAFVIRTLRHPQPVMDLRALQDRTFSLGCYFSFMAGVGIFATIYLTPLYLGSVRGFSALEIGLAVFSTGLFQVMSIPFYSWLANRVDLRWLLMAGLIGFAVSMDEPFSALDTLTRTRIQTLAATLLAGRTVVLITHDPQEACRLSHRLLVLSAADGDIDDSHHLAGTPPRAPDAPDLLIGQAALLQQLMRAQP